jgi:hypothetical protein
MLAQTDAQYQALQGTPWEDAARRTVAFVGVGSKLLDPDVAVPAYAQDLVDAEVALVESAAGSCPRRSSPAWNSARITPSTSRAGITRSARI